jgi:fructose-specific component phosphotransferase system IIB-like protein
MAKKKDAAASADAAKPHKSLDPKIQAAMDKKRAEAATQRQGNKPLDKWELGSYVIVVGGVKPSQPTRFGKPCCILGYMVEDTGEERVSVVPASAKDEAVKFRKGDRVAVTYNGKVPNPSGEGMDVHDLTFLLIDA